MQRSFGRSIDGMHRSCCSGLGYSPLILSIPHSSTFIPDERRRAFLVDYLDDEMMIMTDWFTDELFGYAYARTVKAAASRLAVDVERFWNDEDEIMAKVGMGAVYAKTSRGDRLVSDEAEREDMKMIYDRFHGELEDAVDEAIARTGVALIVDCHSFSSMPLPHEPDKSVPRPDICIGTDGFHTPSGLADLVHGHFISLGFRIACNTPFSGSIVPMRHYRKDRRVMSVMIEINRSLYMDEMTCDKDPIGFQAVRASILQLLRKLEQTHGE